jgi:hypothetical protein
MTILSLLTHLLNEKREPHKSSTTTTTIQGYKHIPSTIFLNPLISSSLPFVSVCVFDQLLLSEKEEEPFSFFAF